MVLLRGGERERGREGERERERERGREGEREEEREREREGGREGGRGGGRERECVCLGDFYIVFVRKVLGERFGI